MKEQWRDVPGYEGLYRVSDHGRVFGVLRGGVLSPYLSNKERAMVTLYRRGACERVRTYRLVLLAFRGPPPKNTVACHNDGNPHNNHISNLRWDTTKNNHADKYKHGTAQTGENHPRNRFTEQDVLRMREMRRFGAKFTEIANVFGTAGTVVGRICRRQSWTHI